MPCPLFKLSFSFRLNLLTLSLLLLREVLKGKLHHFVVHIEVILHELVSLDLVEIKVVAHAVRDSIKELFSHVSAKLFFVANKILAVNVLV